MKESPLEFLKKLWDERPLALILYAGIFFRLLSVIFSKGYGMSDDHFLVIEPAQAWVEHYNYDTWYPDAANPDAQPTGHSFFYPGLHYILFLFFKFIGFNDPQGKMYFVRALHAACSLVIIWCGYKITEKFNGVKAARMTGLLLSVFWFMPFLSVRNLVEVACIPPLMYATWLIIRDSSFNNWKSLSLAGIMLAIAFSIRYQTILFTAGLCLAMVLKGRWKAPVIVFVSFFLVATLIQAIPDYIVFGKPFVEFKEYIRYNRENAYGYFTNEWYMYLVLIAGLMIPPISLFLLFGFFKEWRKHLYLFLPAFIFLAFHSYFPNKQERFILPVFPFIITLGYIGWDKFYHKSEFWKNNKKLYHGFWIFFWIINTIPLFVVSMSYSKKNRVESMVYLAKKGDVVDIVIDDSNRDDILIPPQFYLRKFTKPFRVTKLIQPVNFYYEAYLCTPQEKRPNYVVFMQRENIVKRVVALKKYLPTLTYETTIEPSFIDWLLNKMNWHNKNQTSFIYRIN
jgi:hypothetical protein